MNMDFGTTGRESFEAYIIRVSNLIDDWKVHNQGTMSSYLQGIIINIFEDVCLNSQNQKYQQMYNMLKHNLKREPTNTDFYELIKLIQNKMNEKLLYGKQLDV